MFLHLLVSFATKNKFLLTDHPFFLLLFHLLFQNAWTNNIFSCYTYFGGLLVSYVHLL